MKKFFIEKEKKMKKIIEKISNIITKIWVIIIIISIIITAQIVIGWNKSLSHPINKYSLHGYQLRASIHKKIQHELDFNEYEMAILEAAIFFESTPSYWLNDGGANIFKTL